MIHCKDCKFWDESEYEEVKGKGLCSKSRVIAYPNSFRLTSNTYYQKNLVTPFGFGCVYGVEKPQCPTCETGGNDYSGWLKAYRCPNKGCRTEWFREESQCTQ